MDKLSIRLFGQVEVVGGGGMLVPLRGRKQQALLVYLALNIDRTPSREKLATMFWGDRFDAQARQSLRQAASRLRMTMTNGKIPILLTEGDHIGLNLEAVEIDAREFERQAADGSPKALAAAAYLYKDVLADGLRLKEAIFDDWIGFERSRLQEIACDVLLRLANQQADARETQAAIETGRRLIGLDPTNEAGHRLLMRIHAENGQRTQALKQYRSCTALLLAEIDTEPDAETQRLNQEILASSTSLPEAAELDAALPGPSGNAGFSASEKPTVAVLPFDDMGGNKDQDHVANGMTEDIITSLTKYHWLAVIARNSTTTYKGQAPDVRRVGEELGADYIIEGSIRRIRDHLRVTVQLIDAGTGKHIWAERYDRDIQDIFSVQDEMTATIAATIEPELALAEGRRAGRKPTESLDAWDCYHLGLSRLYQFSRESNLEAQRLFKRAVEIDPGFSSAYARLAYAMVISAVYFDADPTPELLDEALRVARLSAELDDKDAVAHFAVGRVHLARGEYSQSIAELQTSIGLNPCLAQAHCGLGDSLAYAGRLDESVASFDEAVRLSPHDPYRWGFLMYGAMARLFMKQHEAAARWARDAVRVPNSHYWANAALVAALGHLDLPEETRAAVAELLRRKPGFTCQFARNHLFYVKDPVQVEHFVAGLRKAGLSENDAPLVLPSIAVLPFKDLSNDAERSYLGDGLADDFITGLSRFRWLIVIARGSSFSFNGNSVDVRNVALELGVRYILTGSVREDSNHVRLVARLIDAGTGYHIWAETYNRELADMFAVHAEITEAVVSSIAPEIDVAERKRLRKGRTPPKSFDAWSLYQRGLAAYYATTEVDLQSAVELFDLAGQQDQQFAPTFAMAADARIRLMMHYHLSDPKALIADAQRSAQMGIELDQRDPICLWADGRVNTFIGNHALAITQIKEAVTLNPSYAMAHYALAFVLTRAGRAAEAIDEFDHAIRLSPRDAFLAGFRAQRALALFDLERYEESVEWANRASRSPHPRYWSFVYLAAALTKLGREDEARAAIDDVMARAPHFSLDFLRGWWGDSGERTRNPLFDALRKAGLS